MRGDGVVAQTLTLNVFFPGGFEVDSHTTSRAPKPNAALKSISSTRGWEHVSCVTCLHELTWILTAMTTEISSLSSSLITTSFFKVRLHNLQRYRGRRKDRKHVYFSTGSVVLFFFFFPLICTNIWVTHNKPDCVYQAITSNDTNAFTGTLSPYSTAGNASQRYLQGVNRSDGVNI